ncbi:hypothetical protein B0I21_10139 [Sphingobacterium paludis]|uniref:Uncharacterized protein n=1 Tax=Sphingobacterium paludis TaxID=1476465 RepID=A0A4R7D8Z0_9SPHI|nr:hypothetical protein B0I21_10139 [Sphingobacterium paludis]
MEYIISFNKSLYIGYSSIDHFFLKHGRISVPNLYHSYVSSKKTCKSRHFGGSDSGRVDVPNLP